MINNLKKLKTFHLIILLFAIIFSLVLFLSIPSLFDYKTINKKLEDKIKSEFKMNITNISNIKYGFLPSPHLQIEEADLKFLSDEKNVVGKLNKIKVFISLIKFMNKKNISIEKITIENLNLNFQNSSFKAFFKHFNNNINKPIHIKNSKFFYINRKNEVATISTIKKLDYYIDLRKKEKKLYVNGKLFDTDFVYIIKKNYQEPNNKISTIVFKKPNINIKNTTKKVVGKNLTKGELTAKFLRKETFISYLIDKNFINLQMKDQEVNDFAIEGKINLQPFYFNIDTILKDLKVEDIIKYFLFNIYSYKESVHPNLNGTLKIDFTDIKNDFFNNGSLDLNFNDSKLDISNNQFNINDIGKLNFKKILFKENQNKIVLITKVSIKITNQLKLYRKFSIKRKNRIELESIDFDLDMNIDDNVFYISNIFINNKNVKDQSEKQLENSIKYEIENFQQLRKVTQEVFESLN